MSRIGKVAVTLCSAALLLAAGLPRVPVTRLEGQTHFSVVDVRQDFALLRSSIQEAHAGLYVYRTAQQIAQLFDSVQGTLHDMTEAQFFRTIAPLLAEIRDGHTRSLPSERWMTWYADSARVLPVRLRFVAGHAFVSASSEPGIERGDEVLAIDNHSVTQLMAELGPRLPRDGRAATGITGTLNTQFDLWYYLFIDQPAQFRLTIRRSKGDTVLMQSAAIPPAALPVDRQGQARPLELRFLSDSNAAVLRIATFAAAELATAGIDYAAFLYTTFERLSSSRTSNLVIDLRGNDGGRDTYGSLLLRHLVDHPFAYYRRLEARTDRISFWPHTQLDSSFNSRFGAGMVRTPNGTYQLPVGRHQNLGLQTPRPPLFRGRVWVLIDGGTFSTAAEFCSIAWSLGRATFVGEETGGSYEGNASGTFAILTLPHTGIRIVIPLVRYELAVAPPRERGRGIIPTYHFGGPPALDGGAMLSWLEELIRRRN
jgi:hypothetical protein